MLIFSNKLERDYNMILKLSRWKQNLLFRRGKVQKKTLVVEKKYVWSFLLYLWVKATDHEILWLQPGKCWSWSYGRFFYFPMGQCKMQTADWLWTIVFRVRKQWDYCCHVLICMVKTIVCSLRHFTLTNFPIWIWQIHNLYVSYRYSNSLSPQLQWSRNVFERWTMSVLVGMDWA